MSCSQQDLDACQTLQIDEREALEAIYPDIVASDAYVEGRHLKLDIPVQLQTPKTVCITQPPSSSSDVSSQTISQLSALPSLVLRVKLAGSYPLHSAPEIVSLDVNDDWLSDVGTLRRYLLGLWQDGEPVLCRWVEYIQTGEFLEALALLSGDGDHTLTLTHSNPQQLATCLHDFNKMSQTEDFEKRKHQCSICMSTPKGRNVFQLRCQHVYCLSCLREYWTVCVRDGNLAGVACPDQDCMKRKECEASPDEVQHVLDEIEFDLWQTLRERRELARDPTLVYCPAASCRTAVTRPQPVDAGTLSSSGWNRHRECPKCSFSFCSVCLKTWHGPLVECQPRPQYDHVALEWFDLPAGSVRKNELERVYGIHALKVMTINAKAEIASAEYLSKVKQCPGCRMGIEIDWGCNRVICPLCWTFFCLNCLQILTREDMKGHGAGSIYDLNSMFDMLDGVRSSKR